MNFKPGDKVRLNALATKLYGLTTEGSIGTIINCKKDSCIILFSKEENKHCSFLHAWLSGTNPPQEFEINRAAIELLDLTKIPTPEQRCINKIKTLDNNWANKQKQKGKSYALLLL